MIPAAAPLVCLGHSHVRSVADAARDRGVPLVAIDFWHVKPSLIQENGRTRFCDAIVRELAGGPVFSLIGGTAHHKLGLVVHPRRFDFVLPAAPDLVCDERAEVVPFDAVKAAVLQAAQPYLDLMQLLSTSNPGPVFHCEPPPVYADEARLAPDVPWMFFEGRRTVSPRLLRYKLWRLHADILREWCRDCGITFVPHPPEAVDDQGFLLPEHYLNAMHVSSRYGALVLEQMRALA